MFKIESRVTRAILNETVRFVTDLTILFYIKTFLRKESDLYCRRCFAVIQSFISVHRERYTRKDLESASTPDGSYGSSVR